MSGAPEPRFGILLSTNRLAGERDADVVARTLALTQQAESLGYDEVWVVEHHFTPDTVSPSALALASFLLGRTRRLRVGSAVTLLPLHHPVHVAEQAALLDHLSGGRFLLGVGRGVPGVDQEVFSAQGRWRDGLPEALDLVADSFSGRVEADSARYSFPSVSPVPAPLTPSGPPVYLAASSHGSAETAGSRGLPMLLYFDKYTRAKVELLDAHAKAAHDAGRDAHGHDHAFAAYAHVTEDRDEARDMLARRAASFAGRAAAQGEKPPPDMVERITDVLESCHPVGTAAECAERLVREITATGCRRVLFHVEMSPDASGTSAARNAERLARHVFPEVRRRLAPSGRG